MGKRTLVSTCCVVALVCAVGAADTGPPFVDDTTPDPPDCCLPCTAWYNPKDCCLACDCDGPCCTSCSQEFPDFILAAQIALGATLVIALLALACVVWKTYRRRNARRGTRREREADAASLNSQELFVAQMMRDRPPTYDIVTSQDKPPSYRNLQILQTPASPESPAPRSPGTRLRSRSNASIVSNPPPYDSVFSISLQIEQDSSTPTLQEAPEGVIAVRPEAVQPEQMDRRVQWTAGDESQDEDETNSKIASTVLADADSCRNRIDETAEGCDNLAFHFDEKETESAPATSNTN